jgi:H+/Cl- antiporter ClcA
MTLAILCQIVVTALIAIAFAALFLILYAALNNLIWTSNDFIEANRWMIPAGVLIFSLLVGLCQRYLRGPTVIHGGFVESLKGEGGESDYRTFPGALLSALFSLLSGASIGPEGAIAALIGDISSFLREKLKLGGGSADTALGFDVAALASAFNGIIGNVLFTGIFATEFRVGGKNALRFLTWNLLAGTIGFLFYMYLGLPSFARMIPFTPLTELRFVYILYAIALGILGGLLAIFTGISMQGIGTVMEKTFRDHAVPRILAAGGIIALVGYFIPNLLFSGEAQIHAIIAQPAQIGVAMLVLMAVLKILLLALSFKSGYLGGPIFPILFSSTMIGLALSLVFPEVPIAIFVMCIEVAAITLALGAPLTAILLVAVVGSADPYMAVLLVISAVTAMILAAEARRLQHSKR